MKIDAEGNAPGYFVFDICDTLFYSNTTFDFIKYVLHKKKLTWDGFKFSLYTQKKSPVFIALYFLQKITGKDWPKTMCLHLLKGLTEKELLTLGDAFVLEYLSGRRIEQTHKLLHEFIAEGKTVILLSASIDPVVSAIAKMLGVNFRSSELKYDPSGRFTGNLKKEMTGQKLAELRKMLPGNSTRFAVATDNLSDRGLVEAACQRYIVVYSDKAQHFWQDLGPNFIKLNYK